MKTQFKNSEISYLKWIEGTSIPYLTPNDAYEYFLNVFSGIYDLAFLLKTISVKRKTLRNSWITKGLLKSSKRKQKLYERFLKTIRNKNVYKR